METEQGMESKQTNRQSGWTQEHELKCKDWLQAHSA